MRQRFSRSLFPLLLAGLMCGNGLTQQQDPSKLNPETRREVHSKPYHPQWRESIPEMLAKTAGDLHLVYNQPPGFTGDMPNPSVYPPYPLPGLACNSDVVIEATAESGVSALTKNETFIYTDWDFTVLHVLKDTIKSPITGSKVVVTRPGGKLQVHGRTVIASDANFKDFAAGGRYLLFLDYIPEAGAFRASAEKTFDLGGGQVTFFTPYIPYPKLAGKDPGTLLNDSYAAVAAQAPACIRS